MIFLFPRWDMLIPGRVYIPKIYSASCTINWISCSWWVQFPSISVAFPQPKCCGDVSPGFPRARKQMTPQKQACIGIQQINEICIYTHIIYIYIKDAKGSNKKQQIWDYSIFSIEIYSNLNVWVEIWFVSAFFFLTAPFLGRSTVFHDDLGWMSPRHCKTLIKPRTVLPETGEKPQVFEEKKWNSDILWQSTAVKPKNYLGFDSTLTAVWNHGEIHLKDKGERTVTILNHCP